MSALPELTRFNDNVLSKYQIYNSIFITLPFDTIDNTGVLLPLFHKICEKGFEQGKNPTEIVEEFFTKYQDSSEGKNKTDLLFQFIQYIERQVVLFDAIEDAAFPIVNNMDGIGTLRNSKEIAILNDKKEELKKHLEDFKVRVVLTAHPTQFYPGHSVQKIYNYIQHNVYDGHPIDNEIIDLGFWPGGDRDGNPFVTTQITLDVAERLRQSILRNYYRDVRRLKRRFTFDGVHEILSKIEKRLYKHVIRSYSKVNFSQKILLEELYAARDIITENHNSLFIEELNDFINKVRIFGFHFATLDIRQDSRVHHKAFTQIVEDLLASGDATFPKNYHQLSEDDQIKVLAEIKGTIDPAILSDEMSVKTIESIYALKTIQQRNGERGANRYIISNNQTALNVMQTFAMLNLCGFENELPVDVIPLFETVDDLENASDVMRTLYTNNTYRYHLSKRKNKQTIMLGFSDGTKDGGFLKPKKP